MNFSRNCAIRSYIVSFLLKYNRKHKNDFSIHSTLRDAFFFARESCRKILRPWLFHIDLSDYVNKMTSLFHTLSVISFYRRGNHLKNRSFPCLVGKTLTTHTLQQREYKFKIEMRCSLFKL